VVDNDRNVLVALLVTGLVNANVHEVIKPLGTLGLDVIQRPVDATAYRFPVYAHILRHDAPREIYGKPANRQVKVTGKSASRISPGNVGCYNAMLRAFNAVSQSLDLYKDGSKVEAPPSTRMITLLVITTASLMTERTIILMPSISSGLDPKVAYAILVIIEVCIFYDSMVDIEQLFT
jgi:hypothetical protein